MNHTILALLQQSVPPITVVVQQPPGMSDGAKVLISASVGAAFGIISSILMEYVKPLIFKRSTKKLAKKHLIAELTDNMNYVSSACRFMSAHGDDDPDEALARASMIMKSVNKDRFEYYFTQHKTILYEIDSRKSMFDFYQAMKSAKKFWKDVNFKGVKTTLSMAYLLGYQFLRSEGISHNPTDTVYDKMEYKKSSGVSSETH